MKRPEKSCEAVFPTVVNRPRFCSYSMDRTQNQADQTRCAACAELPAYTTTLLVLRLPALAYFVS